MLFRVAVAGSRHFRDAGFLFEKLDRLLASRLPEVEILHGACRGADLIADDYAAERGLDKLPFPVTDDEWKKLGKKAGPVRNRRMLAQAHALVAFRAPDSLGTTDAVGVAVTTRLPCVVYDVELDAGGMVRRWRMIDYNRGG